jgi:hypothetical protein
MIRDLDAYRAQDSRLALRVLLGVLVIFAVLFALKSRALIFPGIVVGGGWLAAAVYQRYRSRVRCPRCRAYAMPPFYTGEPQKVLNNFCFQCGAQFLEPSLQKRPVTEAERDAYWRHRMNFFRNRSRFDYGWMGISAFAFAIAGVPRFRPALILGGVCFLTELVRIKRRVCPACRFNVYTPTSPYCNWCGTRLAPPQA